MSKWSNTRALRQLARQEQARVAMERTTMLRVKVPIGEVILKPRHWSRPPDSIGALAIVRADGVTVETSLSKEQAQAILDGLGALINR